MILFIKILPVMVILDVMSFHGRNQKLFVNNTINLIIAKMAVYMQNYYFKLLYKYAYGLSWYACEISPL